MLYQKRVLFWHTLTTVIELTGADFCCEGDHHPLMLPLSKNDLTQLNNRQSFEQISRTAEL
jgi:hypothetical protein